MMEKLGPPENMNDLKNTLNLPTPPNDHTYSTGVKATGSEGINSYPHGDWFKKPFFMLLK
ncbi:MAG: hypothetical protein CM15mP47_2760 [Methanobacteriota archaeon]|nr:MAG: hypothetical protein CM15mP47_2760 [Euryarchaeota archaeon]